MTQSAVTSQAVEKILGESIDSLISIISQSNKKLVGSYEYLPSVQDSGDWQVGPGCEKISCVRWRESLESFCGGFNLEKLANASELKSLVGLIFQSNHCPPTFSKDEHGVLLEVKVLLEHVLRAIDLKSNPVVLVRPKKTIVAELADYLLRNSDSFLVVVPLIGLDISGDVAIPNGEIHPITDSEKRQIFSKHYLASVSFSHEAIGDLLSVRSILTLRKNIARSDGNMALGVNALNEDATFVVKMIRCYCMSVVLDLWKDHKIEGAVETGMGKFSGRLNYQGKHLAPPLTQASDLQQFLDKVLVGNPDNIKKLDFVFERIREAWILGRSQDSIVFELISVLEALFLKAEKDELRFRLSLYVARYFGSNSAEREEYFRLLKKAYDLRSRVAHCAEVKDANRLTADELNTIVGISRSALRDVLSNGLDNFRKTVTERLFS